MTPRQPFSEEMTGGARQLRLFDEHTTESGPATTAGPAPGTSPTDADDTSRTEPQP